MENKPDFDLDLANKWFGVNYNNGIFPLLEKADRTEDETEMMIQMAFASTLHWSEYSGCKYVNKVRGINMIATALAYAGRKESSLFYARQNYEMVMNNINDVEDFDISFMLMQLARSLALNAKYDEAERIYNECLVSIEKIKDEEDKKICVGDLNSGPWYGLSTAKIS